LDQIAFMKLILAAPTCFVTFGHCYEFVKASEISWQQAALLASTRTYNGMTGYLATITNVLEENSLSTIAAAAGCSNCKYWIGLSSDEKAVWSWQFGPERGMNTSGFNVAGKAAPFKNWCIVPSDAAAFGAWSVACWQPSTSSSIDGFIVEYGNTAIGKPANIL